MRWNDSAEGVTSTFCSLGSGRMQCIISRNSRGGYDAEVRIASIHDSSIVTLMIGGYANLTLAMLACERFIDKACDSIRLMYKET